MLYIPVILLLSEAALFFYKYFVPNSFRWPSKLDLIYGAIFLVLAFAVHKNTKKKVIQWVAIIASLILGPGGFIGFGGIFAIALAVSFVVLSKKA